MQYHVADFASCSFNCLVGGFTLSAFVRGEVEAEIELDGRREAKRSPGWHVGGKSAFRLSRSESGERLFFSGLLFFIAETAIPLSYLDVGSTHLKFLISLCVRTILLSFSAERPILMSRRRDA